MKQLIALIISFQFMVLPVAFGQSTTGSASDQFKASPDAKPMSGGYSKQILGMGIGIVGANMLTACQSKIHPSVLIYSAGGIIYILSELMAGKSHNESLKKKVEDMKLAEDKMKNNGGGGEVQKEALESALANEKEILKFINKRKMFMSAVLVVFAASTAAAALEMITPIIAPIGLIPAMCIGPTGGMMAKVTSAAIAAAFSFASGGGITGGIGAALVMYAVPLAIVNTTSSNMAIGRIAVAAASSVIVKGIVSDLSARAKVTQENISKLENAIKEFNASSTPTNGLAQDSTSTGTTDDANATANLTSTTTGANGINRLATSTVSTKICAAQGSQGLEVSDTACASPLRLANPKFDVSMDVPTLKTAGQMATDLGNSLASGDLAGAEVSAANLEALGSRMNQARDNILKQVNKKLTAAGNKAIDLDASAKDQLSAMSNAMKSSSPDSSKALSSMAAGNASLGNDLKGVDDTKTTQTINGTPANGGASGVAAPATAATDTLLNPESGNEMGTGDDLNKDQKTDMAKTLADYEDSANEISNRKEDSLFKLVSARYILNYNKFFKKEAPATTPVVPAPAKKP